MNNFWSNLNKRIILQAVLESIVVNGRVIDVKDCYYSGVVKDKEINFKKRQYVYRNVIVKVRNWKIVGLGFATRETLIFLEIKFTVFFK